MQADDIVRGMPKTKGQKRYEGEQNKEDIKTALSMKTFNRSFSFFSVGGIFLSRIFPSRILVEEKIGNFVGLRIVCLENFRS